MNFKELFTSRNIIIFIVIVLVIFGIFYYSKQKSFEKYTNLNDSTKNMYSTAGSGAAPFQTYETNKIDTPDTQSGIPNRTPMDPSNLLPNTAAANWGNLYPVQNDGGVYVPSMIDPSFSIGINSISSSLKNPSLDLRSEPIIPKQKVSPWMNSSYEPNIGKIGLDPSPSIIG